MFGKNAGFLRGFFAERFLDVNRFVLRIFCRVSRGEGWGWPSVVTRRKLVSRLKCEGGLRNE